MAAEGDQAVHLEAPHYETSREFRVLDQMLTAHSILADRFTRRALVLDLLLLAASVVFCATAFAGDDAFASLGFDAAAARLTLRIASVAAFFCSVASLRVDWKGRGAKHREAVSRLHPVLALFRQARLHDGTWPADRQHELHGAYWVANGNIVAIPDDQFLALKARHLRKVELSKLASRFPACPLFVLKVKLAFGSLRQCSSKPAATTEEHEGGGSAG